MAKKLMMNNTERVEVPIYLFKGATFNSRINQLKNKASKTVISIILSKSKMPNEKISDSIEFSEYHPDHKAYGYVEDDTIYICPSIEGGVFYANSNSSNMFHSQSNLQHLDLSNLNTSNTTNMSAMFYNCSQLKSLDLSSFNTKSVSDMSCMFQRCSQLKSLDLSSFNTVNTTNMSYMLHDCSQLKSLDLSSFNTVNTTNMSGMFCSCSQLITVDISNFNTTNTTNISYMFERCYNLNTSITVMNSTMQYTGIFNLTSTMSNSKLVVKYIDEETKKMAEKLVASKSANSNVFLWEGEDI